MTSLLSFIQFIRGLNMSKEGAYTGGPGVGLECDWVMLNFLKNIMKNILLGDFNFAFFLCDFQTDASVKAIFSKVMVITSKLLQILYVKFKVYLRHFFLW